MLTNERTDTAIHIWTGPFGSAIGDTLYLHSTSLADSGWYYLRLKQGNSYSVLDSILVEVLPLPQVQITADSVVDYGENIRLTAQTKSAMSTVWMGPNYFESYYESDSVYRANHSHEGVYMLEAQNAAGCISVDSVKIQVTKPPVYIPNSFTPNGDGQNDLFRVQLNGSDLFRLKIIDTDGNIVYTSREIAEWNGELSEGIDAPTGVYFYTLEIDQGGEATMITGVLNLFR